MNAASVLATERTNFSIGSGPLRVCLVYPNKYEVGIANLGFQLLYRLLNSVGGVSCERSFLDTDHTSSLETRTPLRNFHLLAFSLPYEIDFVNVVTTLSDSHIPLRADQRSGLPLLLLGGIAPTANPLPYSSLFDLIYLGEAEAGLGKFIKEVSFPLERQAVQSVAQETEGLWVPGSGGRARRLWVADLDGVPSCGPIVTPLSHFSNLLLCDVERGCPFRCRFCLATQAYSPYRARDPDLVLREIVESALYSGGVGLIGAALSDLPGLGRLVASIRGTCRSGVRVSSLRLDRIEPAILRSLVASGLKTVTIAPEAGTERLRWILDKRITDEQILAMGPVLDATGVKRVRLYFMVGLPFEEESDVAGILDLVSQFRRRYRGRLVVSVNPFVPKAHTPFQYHRMDSRPSLARKIAAVKRGLSSLPGTRVIFKSPRESILQGILSLGDSSVGSMIAETAARERRWQAVFREAERNAHDVLKQKSRGEELPWEFIDFGVSREALLESYSQASRLAGAD